MRCCSAVVLLILVGCGPNVEGNWVGDCNIDSATASSNTTVDLDIVADGKEVSGSGALIEDGLGQLDVVVDGSLEGKNIVMALSYDIGGDTVTRSDTGTTFGSFMDDLFDISYEIDAKVKGDTMEGRCTIKVFGFGVGTDIVLERQ